MGWKKKITEALVKHGPMRTGELIVLLGFDAESSMMDVSTRFMDGLKPLGGSFLDSKAQRRLGKMVDRGEVVWQRAANMDNWYRLPEQEFPKESDPRERTLKSIMEEILLLMPEKSYDGESEDGESDEWVRHVATIELNDACVEFCPFVLTVSEDGWELADGDPICNWAGNTFDETYPIDVEASVIVDRMKKKKESDENNSGP